MERKIQNGYESEWIIRPEMDNSMLKYLIHMILPKSRQNNEKKQKKTLMKRRKERKKRCDATIPLACQIYCDSH